jgi:predicted transcriptional regulator
MDEIINLLKSKLKIQILKTLSEALTPIMISKLIKRPRSSISRSILELKQQNLVKCLNPKSDKWRKYEVTLKGKTILKKAEKFI